MTVTSLITALATLTVANASGAAIANKVPLDGSGATNAESNLGDLVADAIRARTGADAAIIPASEIRPIEVKSGQIDSADIVAALRAGSDDSDTVVVLKLTGSQIRRALARATSRAPSPYEGFLQVSGISFSYDPSKTGPERLSGIMIGGSPFNPDGTYRVATTRLLADGALGYFEVWGKDSIEPANASQSLSSVVGDYATAQQPLDYTTSGRIGVK